MGSGTIGNSTVLGMFGRGKLYKLRKSGCLGRGEEMLNTDKTVAQCLTQVGQKPLGTTMSQILILNTCHYNWSFFKYILHM